MVERLERPRHALPRSALALALAPWLAMHAHASDESRRVEELEKQLARSMALIEQLSQRVNQLEGTQGAAPQAAHAPAPQAERAPAPEHAHDSAPAGGHGVPFHGFAHVGYTRGLHNIGRHSGFTLGNLDLYMTPQFGERGRSIVELVFEYGPHGNGVVTELERLQFGYTFSDALTLWVGRFHTPYGYWNAAYHHGQQIQTSATRPRFIEFEDAGGVLPAHAVGLLASGGLRLGAGRLQYDAWVANGSHIDEQKLEPNVFGDDNRNKFVGGNVRYAFGGGLQGWTLGLHAFTQNVASYDPARVKLGDTRVRVAGGFAVYEGDRWQFIGEYYAFRNKDLAGAGGTHSSWAGFAQAGYTFAGGWTPYARVERAALDGADAYFAAQEAGRPYSAGVLGLRYDVSSDAAIKLELERMRQTQRNAATTGSSEARLQFAVRF